MKKKWLKIVVICAFVVLMTTLASVQVFARDFYMAGHYDATGTTTTCYAYSFHSQHYKAGAYRHL